MELLSKTKLTTAEISKETGLHTYFIHGVRSGFLEKSEEENLKQLWFYLKKKAFTDVQ